MESQRSVAVSDGFLAITALHAAYRVFYTSRLASLGFLAIGSAALFGVARFIQISPADGVVAWHKYMAWFASVAGLSMIGCGYSRAGNSTFLCNILLAGCFATLLAQRHLSEKARSLCGDILGGLSLLITLIVAIAGSNAYGILGVLLYVGGSIVLKVNPDLGSIKPVDLFHYALMFGNIALMMGLVKDQEPIYYRRQ